MAENNQNQPKKPLTEADIKEEPASPNQNRTIKIVLIVVGIIVLFSIIGTFLFGWIAARIGTSIFEQATNGSVEINDNGIRFGNEDGEFEISGGDRELPQDFPAGVPIYEPSELAQSSRTRQGDDVAWSVTYRADQNMNAIFSFYESAFSQDGWTVESSHESGDFATLGAEQEATGLAVQLSLMHDAADGNTAITKVVIQQSDD